MTRKDFVLIAGVVLSLPDDVRKKVALEFAQELQYTNDRFDRERFLSACGVVS